MVQYESKRPPVFLITASEIRTEERCGWAVLLSIPRRPVSTQIAVCYSLGLPIFKISSQGWKPVLDLFLRQPAVQQKQLAFKHRVSSAICKDFGFGQVARAREYRPERLDRQTSLFYFFYWKNEVFVVTCCQPALNVEKVREYGQKKSVNGFLSLGSASTSDRDEESRPAPDVQAVAVAMNHRRS